MENITVDEVKKMQELIISAKELGVRKQGEEVGSQNSYEYNLWTHVMWVYAYAYGLMLCGCMHLSRKCCIFIISFFGFIILCTRLLTHVYLSLSANRMMSGWINF